MIKVLCAINWNCPMIYTTACFNYFDWYKYYSGHPNIKVDFRRFVEFPYEKSFIPMINIAIEEGFDFIFTADPDMSAEARIIEQFIAHDKCLVGALHYGRKPPHDPQMWDVEMLENGEIDHFWRFSRGAIFNPGHKNRIAGTSLFKTDIRAGGYNLIKVEAIKQLNPPTPTMYQNYKFKDDYNGWDCDICLRLTKIFGGVYTDLDTSLNVKHVGFNAIGEVEEQLAT